MLLKWLRHLIQELNNTLGAITASSRPRSRSPARRLTLLSVIVIAVIWAIAGASIWRGYTSAVTQWKSTTDTLAIVATAFTTKSIGATDLVLKSMLDWVAEEDIQTPLQFRQVFGERRYFDKLVSRISGIEQIDVATFIDADGRIIIFSRSFPQPGIRLADRDYFIEQSGSHPPPSSLGNVVQNRGTGLWTFYNAKQARSPSGAFLGVVIVGLEAEYFAEFFRRIVPKGDNAITLWRADGTILATSSARTDLLGRRFPGNQAGQWLAVNPGGITQYLKVRRLISQSPDQERILSVKPVSNTPAYLTVSISADTVLEHWRGDRNATLAIAFALTVAVAWAGRQSRRLREEAERNQQVQTEQHILRAVMDMPLAMTAVIDSCGKVLRSNKSFDSRFRGSPAPDILDLAKVDGAEPIVEFVRSDEEAAQIEVRLVDSPGNERILHVSLARQRLHELGRCTIVIGTDVTEHRTAQVAIAQSAKMIMLGEMATGMAHELNQPLNVIHMATQNALAEIEPIASDDSAPPPSPALDVIGQKLRTILFQTTRAASLISHMRVFGRIPKEAARPFDARQACGGALDLIGQQIRASGIEIALNLEERPATVLGHLTMLEQVIVNLLINARDALLSTGVVAKRIDVRCASTEEKVTIEVSDNGLGVAESIRDRIFHPFFTTKPVGQGTGLGLSISYGIVNDMNGSIALVPSDGGACFRIELPAPPN